MEICVFTNILLTFVIFIHEKRPGFSLLRTTQEETINLVSFETEDSFNAFGRLSRIYWVLKNHFSLLFQYQNDHSFIITIYFISILVVVTRGKRLNLLLKNVGNGHLSLHCIDEGTVITKLLQWSRQSWKFVWTVSDFKISSTLMAHLSSRMM